MVPIIIHFPADEFALLIRPRGRVRKLSDKLTSANLVGRLFAHFVLFAQCLDPPVLILFLIALAPKRAGFLSYKYLHSS